MKNTPRHVNQLARINYKLSYISAISSAVLIIPGATLGILNTIYKNNLILKYWGLGLGIFGAILSFIILYSYLSIANEKKFRSLKNIVIISMVGTMFVPIVLLYELVYKGTLTSVIGIVWTVTFGIVFFFFGIILYRLKENIVNISKNLGLLYLILGIAQVTILLVIFAPFLSLVIRIMESIMFSRLLNK